MKKNINLNNQNLEQKNLRIVFWGNAGNCSYLIAKEFKKLGYKVELYLMSFDVNRSDPKYVDVKKYPSWIKKYNNTGILRKIFVNKKVKKHIEKNFDIIIAWNVDTNTHMFKIPVVLIQLGER